LPSIAKIAAQKLAKRRTVARSISTVPPVGALCCTLRPQIAIHARPAQPLTDLAKFARRHCSRASTALKALAQAVRPVSVQSADLCSEARQRVGSADYSRSATSGKSIRFGPPKLSFKLTKAPWLIVTRCGHKPRRHPALPRTTRPSRIHVSLTTLRQRNHRADMAQWQCIKGVYKD
jgi:hypothetical protein